MSAFEGSLGDLKINKTIYTIYLTFLSNINRVLYTLHSLYLLYATRSVGYLLFTTRALSKTVSLRLGLCRCSQCWYGAGKVGWGESGDFTNGKLEYDTLKGRWLPIDTAEPTRLESSAVEKGILLRTTRHEGKAGSTGIPLTQWRSYCYDGSGQQKQWLP